tara:strand:+ start:413 stop:529 length:117 start_codon:yes stop_codon:yes gene_type:complete
MSKTYSKLYLFFWKHPVISMVLSFVKGVLTGYALSVLF